MRLRLRLFLLCTVAVVALVLVACGGSTGTESTTGGAASTGSSTGASTGGSPDGQALLQERCTVCHDLQRVEQQKLDATGWSDIVTRMQSQGAQLSEAEKQTLVDYLAATYGP